MSYSRAEQETSIVWDEESKVAKIYTASPVSMRKLDRLCEQCPNEYRKLWQEEDKQGRITAAKYEVSCKLVRFGKPKAIRDEQREAARERFSRYRAEQSE